MNGMALKGTFKAAEADKAGPTQHQAAVTQGRPMMSLVSGTPSVVSLWSEGFGFIECPEAKEYFGRDVYVNKVPEWFVVVC